MLYAQPVFVTTDRILGKRANVRKPSYQCPVCSYQYLACSCQYLACSYQCTWHVHTSTWHVHTGTWHVHTSTWHVHTSTWHVLTSTWHVFRTRPTHPVPIVLYLILPVCYAFTRWPHDTCSARTAHDLKQIMIYLSTVDHLVPHLPS